MKAVPDKSPGCGASHERWTRRSSPTDILFYNREVYGQEADTLVRKIRELCSERELYEWWDKEIHWSGDRTLVLCKAQIYFKELSRRAKESGWEVELVLLFLTRRVDNSNGGRSMAIAELTTTRRFFRCQEDARPTVLVPLRSGSGRALRHVSAAAQGY